MNDQDDTDALRELVRKLQAEIAELKKENELLRFEASEKEWLDTGG